LIDNSKRFIIGDMMKINTKATNITITPAISDYIEKKVATFEKFLQNVEGVLINVEVGKTTKHHKSGEVFRAEIHLLSGGDDYYAVAETDDLYASIDEVKDEIIRELTSKRKKALRLWRKSGAAIKDMIRGIGNIRKINWRRFKRQK
jgi:putative sigma-54 modulation protein